jgi:hypothetical protein
LSAACSDLYTPRVTLAIRARDCDVPDITGSRCGYDHILKPHLEWAHKQQVLEEVEGHDHQPQLDGSLSDAHSEEENKERDKEQVYRYRHYRSN